MNCCLWAFRAQVFEFVHYKVLSYIKLTDFYGECALCITYQITNICCVSKKFTQNLRMGCERNIFKPTIFRGIPLFGKMAVSPWDLILEKPNLYGINGYALYNSLTILYLSYNIMKRSYGRLN